MFADVKHNEDIRKLEAQITSLRRDNTRLIAQNTKDEARIATMQETINGNMALITALRASQTNSTNTVSRANFADTTLRTDPANTKQKKYVESPAQLIYKIDQLTKDATIMKSRIDHLRRELGTSIHIMTCRTKEYDFCQKQLLNNNDVIQKKYENLCKFVDDLFNDGKIIDTDDIIKARFVNLAESDDIDNIPPPKVPDDIDEPEWVGSAKCRVFWQSSNNDRRECHAEYDDHNPHLVYRKRRNGMIADQFCNTDSD